jgi:hydantoinase/carbamoylase family amidase
MPGTPLSASAARIAADVETLSGPEYTLPGPGISRHAYTEPYARTLEFFAGAFRNVGFEVWSDPVGTLVASNAGRGERCFGLGSHCDSNRNGGRYDGTLGVVVALEVCRLARERRIDLPLRVLSFLEEEASGFGQALLGSSIMLGLVSDAELASYRDDTGTAFPDAARAAGFRPERHREAIRELHGMEGWIEVHIEQGRVLWDTGDRLGVVDAIAGFVHADLTIEGRADHAGATPMGFRSDAAVTAAEMVVELDRRARAAGPDVVGTVGELDLEPGLINVIPGRARLSLDVRSTSGAHAAVARDTVAAAQERARGRGQRAAYAVRREVAPTPMDPALVAALQEAARATGAPWRRMPSGAAHDTMNVARAVPSAMLFVPCREGISHAPEEHAEPGDAALAAAVVLAAVRARMGV